MSSLYDSIVAIYYKIIWYKQTANGGEDILIDNDNNKINAAAEQWYKDGME